MYSRSRKSGGLLIVDFIKVFSSVSKGFGVAVVFSPNLDPDIKQWTKPFIGMPIHVFMSMGSCVAGILAGSTLGGRTGYWVIYYFLISSL